MAHATVQVMVHAMVRMAAHAVVRLALAALVLVLALAPASAARAQALVDIAAYFTKAQAERGAGLARKTQLVDVRPATPGEIVVTMIAGEGQETRSPPATAGDKVVRNRCPETGNEEILVRAATFAQRYDGPIGAADATGWHPYRPRGKPMRFVTVADRDGTFRFTAPWGETMVARPGDKIVQDPDSPKDTYRVAKAAFACTYEVMNEPRR
jgi:hypothetical protein